MSIVRFNGNEAPYLELCLPKHYADQPIAETLVDLTQVFEEALKLADGKESLYGGAWKKQGWMGNFARLQSKMSRLRNMVWRTRPVEDDDETTVDTALDFVNLSAFFILNKREDNRWGGNE